MDETFLAGNHPEDGVVDVVKAHLKRLTTVVVQRGGFCPISPYDDFRGSEDTTIHVVDFILSTSTTGVNHKVTQTCWHDENLFGGSERQILIDHRNPISTDWRLGWLELNLSPVFQKESVTRFTGHFVSRNEVTFLIAPLSVSSTTHDVTVQRTQLHQSAVNSRMKDIQVHVDIRELLISNFVTHSTESQH
ncbi:hypothetical protein D3C86_1423210 [compost metagenome]